MGYDSQFNSTGGFIMIKNTSVVTIGQNANSYIVFARLEVPIYVVAESPEVATDFAMSIEWECLALNAELDKNPVVQADYVTVIE
jgi:hypothetical protein